MSGEDEDCDDFTQSCSANATFDITVGHIEDILIDTEFNELQNEFLTTHYHHFENSEENKLVYMDIFKAYTDLLEKHIEEQLMIRMPSFSMTDFTKQLLARRSELEGEIFEILLTLSDFEAFKEMILDFKAMKEGHVADLCISSVPSSGTKS